MGEGNPPLLDSCPSLVSCQSFLMAEPNCYPEGWHLLMQVVRSASWGTEQGEEWQWWKVHRV